ncbi:MAG: hypothetical protein WBA17_07735 [Saprospiraceae bacterium]
MKRSNIISIYRALDKKEARELGKWLDSPVHNTRTDVQDLHRYLLAGDHLDNDRFLKKERVFRKIFPKEPFDDARLRQTVHFLNRCVEEFLAYRQWKEKEVDSRLSLAAALRRKKLDSPLQRTLNQVAKMQDDGPFRTEAFFRNEFLRRQEIYTHLVAADQRTHQTELQSVADALDQAYLIEKMKLSCEMLFHQAIFKTEYRTELLTPVMDYVERRELYHIPALAIYYYVLKAIIEQRDDNFYFESLRVTVTRHGDLLPTADLRNVYLMAINLTIPKINAGLEDFLREAFEWYRLGLENKILIENDRITRYTFLNVVRNAIHLDELDWVEGFLRDYPRYLSNDYRENTYQFARAQLLFARRDFDTVMPLLNTIDFKDDVHNIIGKTMLLQIFYDLDEFDAFDSGLDSMRTFVSRKQLNRIHELNFQHVIKYLRRLGRLSPTDRAGRRSLYEEIETVAPLSIKDWLLERTR